jgi:hypothetical protein
MCLAKASGLHAYFSSCPISMILIDECDVLQDDQIFQISSDYIAIEVKRIKVLEKNWK